MGPVFFWRDETDRLVRAFTSRHGGVSEPPYASLNLGGHVGDDVARVEENRRRVADGLGVARDHVLFMDQCHGTDVAVTDGPWTGPAPRVDGLVTRTPGLVLAALVADCTPVLVTDDEAGVVGIAHAGRPGMTAGIVHRLVDTMRAEGARRLAAVVGPSICGRCYEVPEVMRQAAVASAPSSGTVSWSGTPAVDVAAGVVEQLHRYGVQVTWVPGCSRESGDLYSHREATAAGGGPTGRYAGLVGLRAS